MTSSEGVGVGMIGRASTGDCRPDESSMSESSSIVYQEEGSFLPEVPV